MVIRVFFRILVGGGDGGRVLLDLPEVPLPHWTLGLRLLGPVTQESLLVGLYDGLRLATIVICVGAANSLANPKRLLRSVPPALYEIGTALVVASPCCRSWPTASGGCAPPRRCAAVTRGRVRGLRRLLVPVLEDALERSLRPGRRHGHPRLRPHGRRHRAASGVPPAALMLLGPLRRSASASTGRSTRPRRAWLGAPMLVVGVLVSRVAGPAAPAAGSAAPATGPTRGGGRRSWSPRPASPSALAVWWMSHHQLRRSPTRA